MDWNNFLKDSGKAALAAVFPENIYCICCGDVTDPDSRSGLCFRCSEKLPWVFENPFRSYMDEFAFDDVWPCVRYGSYARKIMNGLKNGGQSYMAENVGQMLAERVQLEWDMPDLFAAVPSHRSKMQKRGYNQSELLAEAVAKRLKLPYQKGLLERPHPAQHARGQLRRFLPVCLAGAGEKGVPGGRRYDDRQHSRRLRKGPEGCGGGKGGAARVRRQQRL